MHVLIYNRIRLVRMEHVSEILVIYVSELFAFFFFFFGKENECGAHSLIFIAFISPSYMVKDS